MALFPLYTESPYGFTEGKVLLANRAYFAAPNTINITVKANGVAPAGWTDLGSIDGSSVPITKAQPTIIPVETGLFQILRAEVPTKDGDATAKFTVVEYEPAVWAAMTGDVLHSTNTSIWVGGYPLLQQALLLVGQNPVTQSELHHYSPKVDLVLVPTELNKFQAIEVNVKFLKYYPAGDVTGRARDYELTILT